MAFVKLFPDWKNGFDELAREIPISPLEHPSQITWNVSAIPKQHIHFLLVGASFKRAIAKMYQYVHEDL